jgi:LysM repeat protein
LRGFVRRHRAVVATAALVVAVAGCGSASSGAGSSAGASTSTIPGASLGVSLPTASPRAAPVASTTARPSAKPTAKPAKPTPHGTTYVIRAGDTLYAIAVRFKVSVQKILSANPSITNPNQITIGQKIIIPTP